MRLRIGVRLVGRDDSPFPTIPQRCDAYPSTGSGRALSKIAKGGAAFVWCCTGGLARRCKPLTTWIRGRPCRPHPCRRHRVFRRFVGMSKAITTLAAFADSLVAQLPSEPCKCDVPGSKSEPHFAFSRENLPALPGVLRCDDIVASRTEHRYENNAIIDVVNFYATGRTYRQFAVLMLAALFSEGCERAELELSNRQSRIRRVEVSTDGLRHKFSWGYAVRPESYTYHPQIPERWPRN